MKITYGGDTGPNKFFVEYAKGADIAIHESFIPVKLLMEKWVFEVEPNEWWRVKACVWFSVRPTMASPRVTTG